MSDPAVPPTLLVFTLGPAGDAERHRLLPRALGEEELELRRACFETALEAGRGAGCRLLVSCPAGSGGGACERAERGDVALVAQRGGSFGERLAGALDSAFGTTAGPVVLVGSDVPGLRREHVAAAARRAAEAPERVVVGPSPDGGFYLLAAARPIPELAAAVAWCRRDTLASLLAHLAALGREVELLEPLADLDRPADLDRFLAAAPRTAWSVPHPLSVLAAAVERLRRALDALRTAAIATFLPPPRLAPAPVPSRRGPPSPRR